MPPSFQVANKVRSLGITCEVYTGGKKKLGDQFAYADKLDYDFTIVVGPNEMQNDTVNVKNQKTKVQETMVLSEIFFDDN